MPHAPAPPETGPPRPAARPLPEPESRSEPRHDARALTAGGREAEIELDGKTYRLRITRQGKLILTK